MLHIFKLLFVIPFTQMPGWRDCFQEFTCEIQLEKLSHRQHLDALCCREEGQTLGEFDANNAINS